jgi:hypothetical protein
VRFPNGARFAFTIFDDTDDATLGNAKPIYDLLRRLEIRATKTVWPFWHDGPSPFFSCQTMEDRDYLAFVQDLQRDGFEITWHCASFESSDRPRTMAALARFEEVFGAPPRLHANHANNLENVYWGPGRVDLPWLSRLLRLAMSNSKGHVKGSPYWWGDACEAHIRYGRNLTFNRINLASVNPSMPYRDPERPLVPLWFSASDAESVKEFNHLTSSRNQQRLEREGGFTIIATHLGKGFVRDGRLNPVTQANLEELAQRPGWFPTVSELLEWLRIEGRGERLSTQEWRRMQLVWARDLLIRKVSSRWRRAKRTLLRRVARP